MTHTAGFPPTRRIHPHRNRPGGQPHLCLRGPAADELAAGGQAVIHLDLAPAGCMPFGRAPLPAARLENDVQPSRKVVGIKGVKAGCCGSSCRKPISPIPPGWRRHQRPAHPAHCTTSIEEAISSAGGVDFAALDEYLMLRALPGVFCAGEMLDWEAPTGGYLLTACFATGRAAGMGAAGWIGRQ